MGKRNKCYRALAAICCVALLSILFKEHVGAENRDTVTKEICHFHIGERTVKGGCYTKAVKHIHEGNAGKKGGCYTYPVYHLHTGDTAKGGGCYGERVYHVHSGSEAKGGSCYTTPVYHGHTGSAVSGGGCYSIPVPHVHRGTQAAGGPCYEPVYHGHSQACYKEEVCTMKYEGALKVTDTYTMHCYHHGDTQHAVITADYSHSSCGQAITAGSKSMCWTCQRFDKSHTYSKAVCGKEGDTIEGYRLSCPKTGKDADSWKQACGRNTATIERYQKSCIKTAQTTDSYKRSCGKDGSHADAYALDCKKTGDSIEYYEPDCGMGEGEAFALLTLTNTNKDWTSGKVLLEACYREKNEKDNFFLQMEQEAFIWEGGEQPEGAGPWKREVEDNGIYSVRLNVINKELAPEGLRLSIEVRNIDRTAPDIEAAYGHEPGVSSNVIHMQAIDRQPDGSEGSGLPPEAYSYDGGATWCAVPQKEISENRIVQIRVRDNCGNIASASADINNIKTEQEEPKEEPKEEPGEEPKEEPGEEPKEEPGEEPGEEPKEEPGEEPGEEPKEEPKEEPEGKTEAGSGDTGKGGSGEDKKQPENPYNNIEVPPEPFPEPPVKAGKTNRQIPGKVKSTEGKVKNTVKGRISPIVLVEEKETVAPRPVLAKQQEESIPVSEVKSNALPPLAKSIAFTLSSIIGTASLLWLLYVLLRNMKIYYNDGEGGCRYAGSCMTKKNGAAFKVTIPEMILEQSDTGQYLLRPFFIFAEKNKGKELVIQAGERKKSVWIDGEIPLRL